MNLDLDYYELSANGYLYVPGSTAMAFRQQPFPFNTIQQAKDWMQIEKISGDVRSAGNYVRHTVPLNRQRRRSN